MVDRSNCLFCSWTSKKTTFWVEGEGWRGRERHKERGKQNGMDKILYMYLDQVR